MVRVITAIASATRAGLADDVDPVAQLGPHAGPEHRMVVDQHHVAVTNARLGILHLDLGARSPGLLRTSRRAAVAFDPADDRPAHALPVVGDVVRGRSRRRGP